MISAKEAEKIIGREVEPKLEILYPSPREVVFLPEHSNMKSFFSRDYCYVLVHPGFSCQEGHAEYIKKICPKTPYGSYTEYSMEIRNLIRNLETSGEPSLFLIGYDPYQEYPKEFLPPERSFILLTEDTGVKLLDSIEIGKNKEKINLEQGRIYHYLRNNGVKEVRMAGEWTWWDDNVGCVRIAAREFEKKGFEIKGVKGCLYPPFPPTRPIKSSERKYKNVTRKIFENQVAFPKQSK